MAQEPQLFQDTFVVINIWTSSDNTAIEGCNVGHVSLETSYNEYISFWPESRGTRTQTFSQKLQDCFGDRPPSFKQNYKMDCLLEGKRREINNIKRCNDNELPCLVNLQGITPLDEQPVAIGINEKMVAITPCYAHVRLVLYSLSVDKMSAYFNQLKNNIKGWKLVGSNVFTRLQDNTSENCASLAYRLLHEGGMYAKLNKCLTSQTSSIVKPDDLLRHLVAAKEKEVAQYPETKDWKYEEESDLASIKQAYSDKGGDANANHDFMGINKAPSRNGGCSIF